MRFSYPLHSLRESFQAKVFFISTLFVVAVSFSFVIFFTQHDKKSQTDQLVRQGELLASLLAHNSRLGVFAANGAMLNEAADGIMQHKDVLSVVIFNASGQLLAHKTRPGYEKRTGALLKDTGSAGKIASLAQKLQLSAHFHGTDTIEIFAPVLSRAGYTSAEALFFREQPTHAKDNVIGLVGIILDKEGLNKRLHSLVLFAVLIMAVFLLIGSLVAYLMARGITKPLNNLMEGVNALGSKGIFRKVSIETGDEIGKVAMAFNKMIDSLERREVEKRQLEEQLRHAQKMEAKEEWERTFDTVPDLVAILDREYRIVRINKAMADRLVISKEDAIGLKCHELFHGSASPHELCLCAENRAGGETYEAEIHEEKLDCYFWITVSPLKRNDGEVIGSVHMARDITQRKRAEAEKKAIQAKLIQTNKMTSLGLLVSGLAHEVNNPNNNIMFTAHLLAKSWKDAEPILDRYYREEGDFRIGGHLFSQVRDTLPHHITGITENSRRIEGIIKNLKNFVRKGKADLNSPMDVNRTVSVAASILNNQIRKYTGHFKLCLTEGLPTTRGNPQQIEQVVINLIMNALQALPDKERAVRVSTSLDSHGGFVIVEVHDEGCGMPREVRERIFEPFFSTKLESGGTGLGLAISNFIITEHKGLLEFDSEPGKGTTAVIKLPLGEGPKGSRFEQY
ncbi:MAG: PAS domain-containing sensor histidine [Geobacteraceae bacterium]|nr:MAG: PAS domain-containing sensor histidine [Geobacteraceae bacterium]